jgi:hypothetical protein
MSRPVAREVGTLSVVMSVDMLLKIERLAAITGYSKGKVIRKLLDGALRVVEAQDESIKDW